MAKMTRREALGALRNGGELPQLARAVAALADDPASTVEDLLPGLDHAGYVAEQAAMALHRITETPWPAEGEPVLSRRFWELRAAPETEHLFLQCSEEGRHLLVKVLIRAAEAAEVTAQR